MRNGLRTHTSPSTSESDTAERRGPDRTRLPLDVAVGEHRREPDLGAPVVDAGHRAGKGVLDGSEQLRGRRRRPGVALAHRRQVVGGAISLEHPLPHCRDVVQARRVAAFRGAVRLGEGRYLDRPLEQVEARDFVDRHARQSRMPGARHTVGLAIMSPRLAHSEKPKRFLEMIEQYFPNVPKIKLNCRGKPRPGWDAWGNEVEETAE